MRITVTDSLLTRMDNTCSEFISFCGAMYNIEMGECKSLVDMLNAIEDTNLNISVVEYNLIQTDNGDVSSYTIEIDDEFLFALMKEFNGLFKTLTPYMKLIHTVAEGMTSSIIESSERISDLF